MADKKEDKKERGDRTATKEDLAKFAKFSFVAVTAIVAYLFFSNLNSPTDWFQKKIGGNTGTGKGSGWSLSIFFLDGGLGAGPFSLNNFREDGETISWSHDDDRVSGHVSANGEWVTGYRIAGKRLNGYLITWRSSSGSQGRPERGSMFLYKKSRTLFKGYSWTKGGDSIDNEIELERQ